MLENVSKFWAEAGGTDSVQTNMPSILMSFLTKDYSERAKLLRKGKLGASGFILSDAIDNMMKWHLESEQTKRAAQIAIIGIIEKCLTSEQELLAHIKAIQQADNNENVNGITDNPSVAVTVLDTNMDKIKAPSNIAKNNVFFSSEKEIIDRDKKNMSTQIPGLTYQIVPNDDHSLFNAVGLHANQDQAYLRRIVVAHLEHNKNAFQSFIKLPAE